MKNILSKKRTLSFILLSSIFLSFKLDDYLQINVICGTDIHGIGEINIDCYEDIKITALPEDGANGSIISGVITSKGKIHITPGSSSVKIVQRIGKTILEPIRIDPEAIAIGRDDDYQETGNGGNTGKKDLTKKNTFNYTINNQNLIINNLNAVIIHYAIYDMQGILITEVNNIRLTNNTIPIDHLQNDLYIVKIQLENGEVLTKTIAKI